MLYKYASNILIMLIKFHCIGEFLDRLHTQKYEFLINLFMFKSLSPHQIQILICEWKSIHLYKNQNVFKEGDPANYVYVVLNGEIEVYFIYNVTNICILIRSQNWLKHRLNQKSQQHAKIIS